HEHQHEHRQHQGELDGRLPALAPIVTPTSGRRRGWRAAPRHPLTSAPAHHPTMFVTRLMILSKRLLIACVLVAHARTRPATAAAATSTSAYSAVVWPDSDRRGLIARSTVATQSRRNRCGIVLTSFLDVVAAFEAHDGATHAHVQNRMPSNSTGTTVSSA